MNQRGIKNKIAKKIVGIDLATLERWMSKYTTNLYKLNMDQDTKEQMAIVFMIRDFLNIRNQTVLSNFFDELESNEKLKNMHFDINSLEEIIRQAYTECVEGEIENINTVEIGTIDFQGKSIVVEELNGKFAICMGNNIGENAIVNFGTNENFQITKSNSPMYVFLGFRNEKITGMSSKENINEDSEYDDFYGIINTTRNGTNAIKISKVAPSYVLAIDEITEKDKQTAKDKGLSILFIDRTKLAISENNRLEQMQDEFFSTFNPNILTRMIVVYCNNRNSFRDRKDLQEKYFDSLEMQIRIDVIIEELEKCFGTKGERRAKLCLQYIYNQLKREEELIDKNNELFKDEMNIAFLKNRIERILRKQHNMLVETTVNQAIQDIEGMEDLTETEKAYYMYLKLGSVLKHDPTYTLEGNRAERAIVYQYEVDQDGYGICKSIVEEYQKALKRIGIESEIFEVVPKGKFTHKDLIIKTKDGKNIFTNLIGDLSNIQNGKRIRNFGSSKKKIESVEIFGKEYYRRILHEAGDLHVISETELEKMDEKFKHSYNGIYTNDMFHMLRKEIKDKTYLAEFFGTNDEDELIVRTFEFLIDKVGIVNSYNLENMGFYEVTRYYDRLVGTTLSEEEKKHFRVYSDMYTRDENGNKRPGCVIILNVNLPNSKTGKKENTNLYYEYCEDDKTFHKVNVDEIVQKNYISLQTRKSGQEFNEVIKQVEEEKSNLNKQEKTKNKKSEDFDFTDK